MRALAIGLLAAGFLAVPAQGLLDPGWVIVPGGGAAGGTAVYLNGGDIIGPRNVELGWNGDPNGDLAAHDTLTLNYDLGRRVALDDGQKHNRIVADARGVRLYGHIVIHGTLTVYGRIRVVRP